MKASAAKIVSLLCIVAIAGAVLVAGPAAAPPAPGPGTAKPGEAASRPAASPILKAIPAGTLGYVALHNLQAATDGVDQFLKTIGATELLKDAIPGGTLKALLAALPLGEGFNANGGVAVAILDPNAFGIDAAKLIKAMMPGAASAPAGGAAPVQWPVVLFLPGTGVKEVLGQFNPQVAEPYMKVNLDGLDLFAAPLGSYVLLSPNPKALEAVARADKKADDELKGRHARIVRDSLLAVRLNVKAAWPLLQKALKAMDLAVTAKEEGLIDSLPEPVMAYKELKPMLGAYLYLLPQMEELTLGLRIAETGVVMDAGVRYTEGSACAKALAAYRAPQTPAMDLLPGESYIMAISGAVAPGPDAREVAAKALDSLLENPALAKVPAAQRQKVQALLGDWLEELTGVSFVMGGSPADAKGVIGLALVLQGKDADKIKALLARTGTVTEEFLKALPQPKPPALPAPDDDEEEDEDDDGPAMPLPRGIELKDIKIAYEKGQEAMGDVAVDAIVVTLPGMDEGMASMILGKAFGESGLTLLVAAPDKKTVVVSFGNGREGLSRALKAAAGKEEKDKKILAQKETADAMKHMPAGAHQVVLFNMGNYFDVMLAAMKKEGGQGIPIPFAFTCKTPVAAASAAEGATEVISVYVPTEMVKEAIGVYTSIRAFREGFGPGPGPGPAPVPGGDDF